MVAAPVVTSNGSEAADVVFTATMVTVVPFAAAFANVIKIAGDLIKAAAVIIAATAAVATYVVQ